MKKKKEMSLEEAAQRILGACLVEFAELGDDDEIPLRLFMAGMANACGVKDFDEQSVPETITAGEFRKRTRIGFGELARGEKL